MEWSPAQLAEPDRALWRAMGHAVPRYSPMPTPGAASELGAYDVVSRLLRRPGLPWQRWAVRVISERRPESPDVRPGYRFPVVDVTVQRQTGKTTTGGQLLLTRAIGYDARRSYITAQTGRDAVERWGDLAAAVGGSVLARRWTRRAQAGSQRLTHRGTHSYVAPFAPTPDSLHGYVPHDVMIDEGFSFDVTEGDDLLSAIVPAQQTIAERQLLIVSTRGDARAVWHTARVEAGRRDPDASGYLEWSAPEGADPDDPQTWRTHPGLGHLVTLEDLAELHARTSPALWRRAFCNIPTAGAELLLDVAAWAAAEVLELPLPRLAETCIGLAVEGSPPRGAVVAAWPLPDGRIGAAIVAAAPMSADDLAAYVAANIVHRRPTSISASRAGLTRLALDALTRLAPYGLEVAELGPDDWALASRGVDEAIRAGRVVHAAGDAVLTAAVASATPRPTAQSWAIAHTSRPEVLALAAAVRGVVYNSGAGVPLIDG